MEKQFNYKLPMYNVLVMVIITYLLTACMVYFTINVPDSNKLILLHKISPNAPQYTFAAMAAFCFVASLFVTYFAVKTQVGAKHIELTPTYLIVPSASFSMNSIAIPYNQITETLLVKIQNTHMLIIKSNVGESRLLEKSFDSETKMSELYFLLKEKQTA